MRRDRRQRREGAIAVIVAIMLVALMSVMALAFDVGNLYRVRTEEQSAVDAAALAGASALNGTTDAHAIARSLAKSLGNAHVANGSKLKLDEAKDMDVGTWSREHGFVVSASAGANAVQVRSQSAVTTPFAHAGGAHEGKSTVVASATAVGGGPSQIGCAFPMVLPDCIGDIAATSDCTLCLTAANAGEDLMAWAAFDGSSGASHIEDLVRGMCFAKGVPSVDANGVCNGTCSALDLTSELDIKIHGGDSMNKNNYCGLMQQLLNRTTPPSPIRIEVPVVASGTGACSSGKLNGWTKVVGFATVDILAVSCSKGEEDLVTAVPAYTTGSCKRPSGKFIIASISRDKGGSCRRSSEPGGGPTFGTPARVVLVQ